MMTALIVELLRGLDTPVIVEIYENTLDEPALALEINDTHDPL